MSFLLRGPYPALTTTTLLPSPQWGDSKAITGTVVSMRAMDGTHYTYVKSRNGRKKLRWQFHLSRNKSLELREFINSYFSKPIEITDHDGAKWVGYLMNNPFEFTGDGRAAGWPGGEAMSITLDFEEK
jgi:hypothetical protein